MSLPWRAESRVGLAPSRLVFSDGVRAAEADPLEELARAPRPRRMTVVLSSHFVRYAVLPWSEALEGDEDWLGLARHTFVAAYGARAEPWHCRVSPAPRGAARLASAIDAELARALRAMPRVRSAQPYLMAAFNARRHLLPPEGWLVVQEPGRLAIGLLSKGTWRLACTRRVGPGWTQAMPELLDREAARCKGEAPGVEVFLFAEEECPSALGRYRITDITAPRGPRQLAMSCH